jgi:REP element-mobilizing transposase RayT
MPRKLRNIAQGCTHHCFTRCHGKRNKLMGKYGKKYFVEAVNMCHEKYDFELVGAEIVRNHMHLVIKTVKGKESVSAIMQYIKARIAEKYNTAMNETGAFWNERFGSTIVEESENPEFFLFNLLWYVSYNPVRKGLSRDPRNNEIGFINQYLNKDAKLPIKITIHDYFYKLGDNFEECVSKFLKYEDSYRKRLSIMF